MSGATTLCTASGLWLDLARPDPAAIRLTDIARHLSRLNRYTGAGMLPISVAQHSLLVSRAVERQGARLALLALLHDAHEAYTGDIVTPMKNLLGRDAIDRLQSYLDLAVWMAFSVIPPTPREQQAIDEADRSAMVSEWTKAMPGSPPPGTPVPLAWSFLSPERAENQFLDRCRRLILQVPGSQEPGGES